MGARDGAPFAIPSCPSQSPRRPFPWQPRPSHLGRLAATATLRHVGNPPAFPTQPAQQAIADRTCGNPATTVTSAANPRLPDVVPRQRPLAPCGSPLQSCDPPASATRPARVSPSCAWQHAMLNSAAERSPSEMSRGLSLNGRGVWRDAITEGAVLVARSAGWRRTGCVVPTTWVPSCQRSCRNTRGMYEPPAMGRDRVAGNPFLLCKGQRRTQTRPGAHHRPSLIGQASVYRFRRTPQPALAPGPGPPSSASFGRHPAEVIHSLPRTCTA